MFQVMTLFLVAFGGEMQGPAIFFSIKTRIGMEVLFPTFRGVRSRESSLE